MEFGDIIYFILLVFFMILGFFNDSRKKKQQQKQAEAQRQAEFESRPFLDEEEDLPPQPEARKRKTTPPPVPANYPEKPVRREFQSSIDLVSIHEEPSTLTSYTFDYDENSFYEKDPGFSEITDEVPGKTVSRSSLHPLIRDLSADAGFEELKKGLVYGEIMQRKY